MDTIELRAKKRKEARKQIFDFCYNGDNVLIIHYSCESFYDIPDGKTPRITSIAVRYLKTGQTKSFSIHKTAELDGYKFSEIENNYNEIEKSMLDDFYLFTKEHNQFHWIHWNMRDISFGFEALAHRYKVLGGIPVEISAHQKFDLSRALVDIYSKRYIEHPRFEKLCDLNKITKKDFLGGKGEAEAFEKKEFVKLHQSTLRKVDNLDSIMNRVAENKLKTNSKLKHIYGLSPQGIFEMIKENWIWALSFFILGGLIMYILNSCLNMVSIR
ncbi:MAG: hypothetical protein H6Q13_1649 [Bacteroidetes bacterium]|nr:hypothetical protein [Bacteroidota bacterium]